MNAETPRVNGANQVAVGGRFAYSEFTGEIDLLKISGGSDNPRYEVYLAGWSAGFQSQQARIDRLTWERDVLYFIANNKGKTGGDFYTHKTSELWNEAVR